jgi:hypothetical protein
MKIRLRSFGDNLSLNAAATLSAATKLVARCLEQDKPLNFLSSPPPCLCSHGGGEVTPTSIHRYPSTLARSAIPAHRGRQPPVKLPAQYRRFCSHRFGKDNTHRTYFILHRSDTGYPRGSVTFFLPFPSDAETRVSVGSIGKREG